MNLARFFLKPYKNRNLLEGHKNIPIDTRQKIELAEGVEIHLVIAGPFPRVAAFLFDLFFRGLLMVGLTLTLIYTTGEDTYNAHSGLWLLILFFVSWFYHILFEGGKRGATWGKRIVGLRVVQLSGARITYGQAFARNLMRFADMMPMFSYGVGLLSMFLTQRCQRLGDLVANTVVIYDEDKRSKAHMARQESFIAERNDIEPEMPAFPLNREEERAVVEFAERILTWSTERQIELADHLSDITGSKGAEGVRKVLAYSKWILQEKS